VVPSGGVVPLGVVGAEEAAASARDALLSPIAVGLEVVAVVMEVRAVRE
jgi:hypothetical protein